LVSHASSIRAALYNQMILLQYPRAQGWILEIGEAQ